MRAEVDMNWAYHPILYTPSMPSISLLPPREFSARANELLQLACPIKEDTPFFNTHMAQAKSKGMTWVEGLEYVVACRRGTVN